LAALQSQDGVTSEKNSFVHICSASTKLNQPQICSGISKQNTTKKLKIHQFEVLLPKGINSRRPNALAKARVVDFRAQKK
jgi:hypothetical protein